MKFELLCVPEDGNPVSDATNSAKVWKEVMMKIFDPLKKQFIWGG